MLFAAGGVAVVVQVTMKRRRSRDSAAEELTGVRRLAEEDVVLFGEELMALGDRLGRQQIDAETRADYQRALDAYEASQRAAAMLNEPEQISRVTDALATGRYAVACVRARAEGLPVPQLRTPCFFNPQHGPSVRDVEWTTSRHGTRLVPACAQDAARVAARERPEVRTVTIEGRSVPYWEAGAAFLPYSSGYFPAGVVIAGAAVGWAFDPGAASWAGPHGGHDVGGHHGGGVGDGGAGPGLDGGLDGGFDGGGFDGGGF